MSLRALQSWFMSCVMSCVFHIHVWSWSSVRLRQIGVKWQRLRWLRKASHRRVFTSVFARHRAARTLRSFNTCDYIIMIGYAIFMLVFMCVFLYHHLFAVAVALASMPFAETRELLGISLYCIWLVCHGNKRQCFLGASNTCDYIWLVMQSSC